MRSMLVCLFFVSMPLFAQDVPLANSQVAVDPQVRDMDAIVVTGVQPGPGMWKVSKGDHVLWIMGTLTPLPKGMTWLSRDAEAVLAQADQVIDPPGATFGSDIGVVRGMMMIPSLLKARKNPDGKTLREILPPPIYARWSVLKARYLGRDEGVERWRPVFASQELYQAAIKKSGLTQSGAVGPVVNRLAKKNGIQRVPALLEMNVENPKQAVKEFSASSLADIDCFEKTLTRLEQDLPIMSARANAWSIGDIEALRALPYEDQNRSCMNAFLETSLAQKRGMAGLPQRVEAMWLAKAEAALASNKTTFSTLPIGTLLSSNGYLSKLRAKGYLIEEP